MVSDDSNIAVRVSGVHKNFKLPHQKKTTIKSVFTSVFDKKNKSYEVQHALKDISFEVKKGEFFGIVGRNGSGKSTLLKILAGIYQPTKGSVGVKGKLVPFIELGVGFNPELTGRENVFLNGALLGFSESEIKQQYDEIVDFAELEKFMDQKLKNYSSGMQVRLAFSMAIRAEAEILMIDEVLAVGDSDFQKKCFEYFRKLKKNKTTVLFVSHDMNVVREYCDRVVLVERNKIIAEGTPNSIAQQYEKLFIDGIKQNINGLSQTTRWGNKKAKYTKVSVLPGVLKEEEFFKVDANIVATEDLGEVLFGISIKDEVDRLLTGTNNKILGKKVRDVKKGEEIKLSWQVPNILRAGDYFINMSIQSHNGTQVDWWDEAAKLTVAKISSTGFLVDPKIYLSIKRENRK